MAEAAALSRVVARPWFIASLTTLVVNDWLLKPAYGNTITGKLSDFAGLALVAFTLSHLAAVSARRWPAGVLSAGLSLFVAAKCIPIVGAGVENVLDSLLPWSNLFVSDPTDVVALVAVPFAWRSGQQAPDASLSMTASPESTLRWVVGGLALLACTASSATDSEHWLRVGDDGEVVVYETRDGSTEEGGTTYGPDAFAVDKIDGDGSWNGQWMQRDGTDLTDIGRVEESCQPLEPGHCVASPDSLSIAETFDGGDTWSTIWSIDPDSKYASQEWVDSQLHYVERDAGVRQLVLARDGTVVAIVTPDVFVVRSPDGAWISGESWFRPIPGGVIVQLAGGFVLLALVGGAATRTTPEGVWPLSSLAGLVLIIGIVGQVGFVSWLATGALGVAGLVLVVQTMAEDETDRGAYARGVLRGVAGPGVATLVGVLLVSDWHNHGGSLASRRLVHLTLVLLVWALSQLIDSLDVARDAIGKGRRRVH